MAGKSPLSLYRNLPLRERLFVRARWSSAPLAAVAARAPAGRLADVGCGHGLLAAALVQDRADRHVTGVDPDERKIARAREALGALPGVELRVGTVDALLPELAGALDGVVVADVMYLLPAADWPAFLGACRRLLRPGGLLLLKEAEANGSWKYWKCLLQEEVMVRLLRRTRSSGGLGFHPRAHLESLLREQGFSLRETADVSAGYTTPHVLFVAESNSAP